MGERDTNSAPAENLPITAGVQSADTLSVNCPERTEEGLCSEVFRVVNLGNQLAPCVPMPEGRCKSFIISHSSAT